MFTVIRALVAIVLATASWASAASADVGSLRISHRDAADGAWRDIAKLAGRAVDAPSPLSILSLDMRPARTNRAETDRVEQRPETGVPASIVAQMRRQSVIVAKVSVDSQTRANLMHRVLTRYRGTVTAVYRGAIPMRAQIVYAVLGELPLPETGSHIVFIGKPCKRSSGSAGYEFDCVPIEQGVLPWSEATGTTLGRLGNGAK
jgi:hypothetical protein